MGGITVSAEKICCRKVHNIAVQKSLTDFIYSKKSLCIDSYFDSYCSGAVIDISNSVFEINPRKIGKVMIRIPFFQVKKENVVGDISVDLSLIGAKNKKQVIDFFNDIKGDTFKFHIITSSPGIGMVDYSKLLYCNIKELDLIETDKDTIVYLSKNNSSNVYKAHKLVEEDIDGTVIKQIYY